MPQPTKAPKINANVEYLSVSELTVLLNRTLERDFPEVLFSGEISEVKVASSGHVYFVVKDSNSQLSAVMWAGLAAGIGFKVQAGLAVQCHGKPNIYKGNGRFQIVVHRMMLAGEGALQKKFLELKAKLEREGFFAEHRKRPLPFLPRAVGIVTSGAGAALHDIMVRIRERMPSLQVYLADVRVQGEGAAQEIAAGIQSLDRSKLVDVIIVGRGGGSLEDLWAFNEEIVVKAIFACSVPVVSGVGHEIDVSLSDLVADVRAPTPTAAAEIVVPHRAELLRRIGELERRLVETDRWFMPLVQMLDDMSLRLEQRIGGILESAALRIDAAGAKLRAIEPSELIKNLRVRLELLQQQLVAGCTAKVGAGRKELLLVSSALERAFPLQRLSLLNQSILGLELRLGRGASRLFETRLERVRALHSKLEAVSPRRVLQRGFSIVEGGSGIIRSAAQLEANDLLNLTFAEGRAQAIVSDTREE